MSAVFLAVSLVSLAVYVAAFVSLYRRPVTVGKDAYGGLMRTAVSRVFVAGLYTTLGMAAVVGVVSEWIPFAAFTIAQLCWQANALLDVRLRRRLDPPSARGGAHRKKKLRRC